MADSGPTITKFTPSSGPPGTVVTITGTNLDGVTEVSFHGKAGTNLCTFDSRNVCSSTKVTAEVPTGATTGDIKVITPGGVATSATQFTYTGATITGFTPSSGPPGTVVTITGTHLNSANGVTFNGIMSNFTSDTSTKITVKVPTGATTGYIEVATLDNGNATSATKFTDAGPTITGFTPSSGPPGTVVTITGTNLLTAHVTFDGSGGGPLGSSTGREGTVTSDTSTKITVEVPAGATTGYITVTTPLGSAITSTKFAISFGSPTITKFTPTSGPPGTVVTITGTNLDGVTEVSFHGKAGTNLCTFDSRNVCSSTKVTAEVPTGATTGDIKVITPGGVATSATQFTYTGATITGFTPSSGPPGTVVTITGTHLNSANGVTFNGIMSNFTSDTSTKITVKVPTGATTGYIEVATLDNGNATSATKFTDAGPTITGFTPSSGPPGTVVTITGTNLLTAHVTFDGSGGGPLGSSTGREGTVTSDTSTKITVEVPAGATTGYITVTTPLGSAITSTKFAVE